MCRAWQQLSTAPVLDRSGIQLEIDIWSCLISKALPFMALEKPSQSVTSQAVLDINVEPAQVQSSDGDGLLKSIMAE